MGERVREKWKEEGDLSGMRVRERRKLVGVREREPCSLRVF